MEKEGCAIPPMVKYPSQDFWSTTERRERGGSQRMFPYTLLQICVHLLSVTLLSYTETKGVIDLSQDPSELCIVVYEGPVRPEVSKNIQDIVPVIRVRKCEDPFVRHLPIDGRDEMQPRVVDNVDHMLGDKSRHEVCFPVEYVEEEPAASRAITDNTPDFEVGKHLQS
ncbi:hypothetical protein CHU98_g8330 [Xylaria longipes]|nr:hypothetical protein CHU98_g8330 [Xylaria longipes]